MSDKFAVRLGAVYALDLELYHTPEECAALLNTANDGLEELARLRAAIEALADKADRQRRKVDVAELRTILKGE